MNKPTLSTSRDGGSRNYQNLLDGRFNMSKIVRIELRDCDDNDIAANTFDFSAVSLEQLKIREYRDALIKI